ncbi:MAG: hypothetical protein QOC81_2846 [Thermoanaerobaculia bacterium]|jgi:uncharacterized damage-inducible protein DinB|nr:hypothetical protein [Thermoanaerobaculia bacterium]
MSNLKFYAKQWEKDNAAFGRVLRALPAGNLDYKPHERSSSAGNIAWQIAEELRSLSDLIDTGVVNWETNPRPSTLDEIVAAYEANASRHRDRLNAIDDSKWASEGRMLYGGHEVMKATVGDICWSFFLDAIHHRGQLSAYIRPMGGKVPSIYGPSADDSGGM